LFSNFFSLPLGFFFFLLIVRPDLVKTVFFKFFYTGLSHGSFAERWSMLVVYWQIFLENFWTGTGLGGATTFLLLKQGYSQIDSLDPATLRTPFLIATNVTTELLASVGIIGAVCFGYFFWAMWKTFRKAYKIPNLEQTDRIRLTALALSLCVTFFTLQFNQSIMRCYIWVHVGVSMGYAQYLHTKYALLRQKSQSSLLELSQ
jgi:O-antigen ligase